MLRVELTAYTLLYKEDCGSIGHRTTIPTTSGTVNDVIGEQWNLYSVRRVVIIMIIVCMDDTVKSTSTFTLICW